LLSPRLGQHCGAKLRAMLTKQVPAMLQALFGERFQFSPSIANKRICRRMRSPLGGDAKLKEAEAGTSPIRIQAANCVEMS